MGCIDSSGEHVDDESADDRQTGKGPAHQCGLIQMAHV